MKLYHNLAHPGIKETLRRLGNRYFWTTIRKDVTDFVSKCHGCNSTKPGKTITPKLDPRPVLMPRFKDIMCDIVGPLPMSEGYRYLLTVVCRTSRFFDAIPLKEATAKACCDGFIRSWVPLFGLPFHATSDNGNVFLSQMCKHV